MVNDNISILARNALTIDMVHVILTYPEYAPLRVLPQQESYESSAYRCDAPFWYQTTFVSAKQPIVCRTTLNICC